MAGQIGWRKAVGVHFDTHEALATAAPYSVSVLAYASDFLYHQGFLCYRVGHEIRLLDVHGSGTQERILNLYDVLPRLESCPAGQGIEDLVTLVNYSEGIVAFRVTGLARQNDALLAIDMAPRPDQTRKKRLLLETSVPADSPIFVRHSRSYMWYGIFTPLNGSPGVWSIRGLDLTTFETFELLLDRIEDSELGHTFCFEMVQDYLYAVSTQIALDDEPSSSFYYWMCQAPREKKRQWTGRLWRREHREGPINEMWTDLSIRTDQTTGRPVIVECRREWLEGPGKSENHRTVYLEALPTPKQAPDWANGSWTKGVFDKMPENLLPYNKRPEKRVRRDYHSEFEAAYDPHKRQEFIAIRTKHRTYDLAASTYIDLVNDPTPYAPRASSRDNLRLRAVSRKRKCPFDEEECDGRSGRLLRPTDFEGGQSVEGSDERFEPREVHLWPGEDAPSELKEILCPDPQARSVRAISDERSLIYSVSCAGLPEGHTNLVMVSFDPTIRFPTFTSLRTGKAPDRKGMFMTKTPSPSPGCSLVREVRPLYQAIGLGYWLR